MDTKETETLNSKYNKVIEEINNVILNNNPSLFNYEIPNDYDPLVIEYNKILNSMLYSQQNKFTKLQWKVIDEIRNHKWKTESNWLKNFTLKL